MPYSSTQKSTAQATATTATAVAAGNATSQVRVLSAVIANGGTAQSITLQSHTTTSNKLGPFAMAVDQQLVLPYNPDGWLLTTNGEGLDIVTSGASAGTTISLNTVQF